MSGRIPPLYCTLILITMHSHQSYPSITTVIHSHEYSPTVDNIIVPSRHTRMGAWVNSKMYTSILYNFINCHARVFKGCKYKTSSWDLTRFPDADNIGSTVSSRGETRYTVHSRQAGTYKQTSGNVVQHHHTWYYCGLIFSSEYFCTIIIITVFSN